MFSEVAIWRCVGAMLALFFALGRFLTAFCVLAAFVLVLGRFLLRFGALQGRFWRVLGSFGEGLGGPQGLFFNVFACTRACIAPKLLMRKNHSFS